MDGRAPALDRHQQLLIDSGRVLMLIGTIIITHQLGVQEAGSSSNNTEHLLIAFVLWLLGAALAMLSFVQSRRFAAAGATLAMALRNYLLGGL